MNPSRIWLSNSLGSTSGNDVVSVVAALPASHIFETGRVLVYSPQDVSYEFGSLVLGESVQELVNYVNAGLVPLSTVTRYDESLSAWGHSSCRFAYSLAGLTVGLNPDPCGVVGGVEFIPAGSPVSGFYADTVSSLRNRVLGYTHPVIYHGDLVRHDPLSKAPYSCTSPGYPDRVRNFIFCFPYSAYSSICLLKHTFEEISR